MKEYLIEIKKHHDSLDKSLQMGIGAKHFKEFIIKFSVKNYKDISLSFVRYLNGQMSVDKFIKKVKIN